MTFYGDTGEDKTSMATARLRRACYHTTLQRLYDEQNCCWTGRWFCKCGYEFDEANERFQAHMKIMYEDIRRSYE